jgi:hypothetical protein
MTPLMLALLSGFLRAQLVAQLQFGCVAVQPDPDRKDAVQLFCVLLDDKQNALKEVRSQVLRIPEKGISTSDLADLYCGAAKSAMAFEGAAG